MRGMRNFHEIAPRRILKDLCKKPHASGSRTVTNVPKRYTCRAGFFQVIARRQHTGARAGRGSRGEAGEAECGASAPGKAPVGGGGEIHNKAQSVDRKHANFPVGTEGSEKAHTPHAGREPQ